MAEDIIPENRTFQLSSGERVNANAIERQITGACHYIKYAIVAGEGREYPVALIFPYTELLQNPTYELSPEEGCFCPRSLEEISKCLRGCLRDAIKGAGKESSCIRAAMVINDELPELHGSPDASVKATTLAILDTYKAHLDNLYGAHRELGKGMYLISLE